MDLVITPRDGTIGGDHIAAVDEFLRAWPAHRDRADIEPDARARAPVAQAFQDGMALLLRHRRGKPPAFGAQPTAIFRQEQNFRARRHRLFGQPDGLVQGGLKPGQRPGF